VRVVADFLEERGVFVIKYYNSELSNEGGFKFTLENKGNAFLRNVGSHITTQRHILEELHCRGKPRNFIKFVWKFGTKWKH